MRILNWVMKNLKPEIGLAVTGVIGYIGTGLPPFVALRADMDALLTQGTVVLVFQPAEEGGAGAKKILDAGALENVSAIFGLHVLNNLPLGEVAFNCVLRVMPHQRQVKKFTFFFLKFFFVFFLGLRANTPLKFYTYV